MYVSEFYTWCLQLFNPKLKFANECWMNNIFLNWTIPKIGIADILLLKWVFRLVCSILPFSYISWETSVFTAKWPLLTRPSDFDRMNCLQPSSAAGRGCCKLQPWRGRKIRCKYTQIAVALRNCLLGCTGKSPHTCAASVFMKAVISFSFHLIWWIILFLF